MLFSRHTPPAGEQIKQTILRVALERQLECDEFMQEVGAAELKFQVGGGEATTWKVVKHLDAMFTSTDRSSLASFSFTDALTFVHFPGMVVDAMLMMYPGTLFAAIRRCQVHNTTPAHSGAPDAFDV